MSEELFKILTAYYHHIRPIISGTSDPKDHDLLWVSKGGKALSSKCIRDVYVRGLSSGGSNMAVTPSSIRQTLSNIAHITQKRVKRTDSQNRFTNAIAFSMRHSVKVHEQSYVRSSMPLLKSRTDSLESKILNGTQLSKDDINSVTDESIHTVLLPKHPPAKREHTHFPKEYAVPDGNKTTYHYIQDLFDGNFSHKTDASVDILREKLESRPETAEKIQQNLGLHHLECLTKLIFKVKTYKDFLKRHRASFWKQSPGGLSVKKRPPRLTSNGYLKA